MAVIDYDKSPNISTEECLKSLADSVRRAFDEITGELEEEKESRNNKQLEVDSLSEEIATSRIGINTTAEIGRQEHIESCQRFVNEMNRVAKNIGMTNSTFKTPSGLCRNFINAEETTASTSYNSYTTAYDLLLLLIAARHTPTALLAMGTEEYSFKKGDTTKKITHGTLASESFKTFCEENGYTLIAAKGGSLTGSYGEIGKNGIKNGTYLIEYAEEIYGVTIVGMENTSEDVVSMQTLIHDLIEMVNGAAATTTITEVTTREYPVGLAVAKLTKSGTLAEDVARLSTEGYRVFFNEHTVRPAASTTKILTAIVCSMYFENHYCTVNYDDLVGGSNIGFEAGEITTTEDALYIMMLQSDNEMATLLAREFGKQTRPSRLDAQNGCYLGINPIKSVEEDTTVNWVALGIGVAYFNKIILNNQPTTYGFVENMVSGSLVYQIFYSMNGKSPVWYRSGNASGWYSDNWVKTGLAEIESPNGTKYTITVDDDGNLSATPV